VDVRSTQSDSNTAQSADHITVLTKYNSRKALSLNSRYSVITLT